MDIKKLRLKYGMTQKQLSEKTGIPKRTIEDWESGNRVPPPYMEPLIECYVDVNLEKSDHESHHGEQRSQ